MGRLILTILSLFFSLFLGVFFILLLGKILCCKASDYREATIAKLSILTALNVTVVKVDRLSCEISEKISRLRKRVVTPPLVLYVLTFFALRNENVITYESKI